MIQAPRSYFCRTEMGLSTATYNLAVLDPSTDSKPSVLTNRLAHSLSLRTRGPCGEWIPASSQFQRDQGVVLPDRRTEHSGKHSRRARFVQLCKSQYLDSGLLQLTLQVPAC